MKKSEVIKRINDESIIAVVRADNKDLAIRMIDAIIKGGKIVVYQKEHGLHIQVVSDNQLNTGKLEQIDMVIKGNEVTENPSSFAPLYYLLSYLEESKVPVFREQNTLIIGE